MLVLLIEIRLRDQRLQILVEDLVFLVGQVLEALERRIQVLLALEIDVQFLETALEGVAAGMLA